MYFYNHTEVIFLFVATIISLLVTRVFLFIICKHAKFKIIGNQSCFTANKEVGAVTKQEHFSTLHDIECTCKTVKFNGTQCACWLSCY